jgi:uncharacterized protein (TIGR00725 family)
MQLAETMGRLIAENNFLLVNGGKGGVMEASARGAHAAGGLVMAILPGQSRTECNDHIDLAVVTGLGYLRNAVLVLNCDALVAIDGEYGTLSEIAYSQIYKKPVYGLDTWNIPGIIPVATPAEAMAALKKQFEL